MTKPKPKQKPFAAQLRKAREEKAVTQEELASALGVVPLSIHNWEQAKCEPQDTANVLATLARIPARTADAPLTKRQRDALIDETLELTDLYESLGKLRDRAAQEVTRCEALQKRLGGRALGGADDPAKWRSVREHLVQPIRLVDMILQARTEDMESGAAWAVLRGPLVALNREATK